jgi:rare lipoprotein A
MRPTPVRKTRRGRMFAGALMMGIPAAAAALTAGQALAASASPQSATTVAAQLKSGRIAFDHPVVLTGSVPTADAGHKLQLQFLPAGGSSWRALRSTTAGPQGHYRLSAPLRRSGYVRVVDVSAPADTTAPVVAHVTAANAQRVAVAAKLRVQNGAFASLGGRPISVRGRFLPEMAGRIVRLQATTGHGWRTVDTTRTGRAGGFTLRFTPHGGTEWLRVRFSGDRVNAKSTASVGSVSTYSPSIASWYSDGGSTACGFHAYYGVANKSLPCGTKVQFEYGGRTVTATVDDRGPYVGGRTWDLNQNTAGALGFGGVGTVWAAY